MGNANKKSQTKKSQDPGTDKRPSTSSHDPGTDERPSTSSHDPGTDERPSTSSQDPGTDERPSTSSQDPGTDERPSTSGTVAQKAKSCHKPKTPSKKNHGECSFGFKNPNKVRKTIEKGKKTPPLRALKRKASWKAMEKTKNVVRKAMYGHYPRPGVERVSTETEPNHSSLGSSTASITDSESK